MAKLSREQAVAKLQSNRFVKISGTKIELFGNIGIRTWGVIDCLCLYHKYTFVKH